MTEGFEFGIWNGECGMKKKEAGRQRARRMGHRTGSIGYRTDDRCQVSGVRGQRREAWKLAG
jgi:hypothetical protein